MRNRIITLLLTFILTGLTLSSYSQGIDTTQVTPNVEDPQKTMDSEAATEPPAVSPSSPSVSTPSTSIKNTPTSVRTETGEKSGNATEIREEEKEQTSVLKKYCLTKDTTVSDGNHTFKLYEKSWMVFVSDTMKLFYKKDGKIDTLNFDVPSSVRDCSSGIPTDTVMSIISNFQLKFKRLKVMEKKRTTLAEPIFPDLQRELKRLKHTKDEKTTYYDSLYITSTEGDSVFLHLPSFANPLLITKDTVIYIPSYDPNATTYNDIVAHVRDNVPIYFEPIPIDEKITPNTPKPWWTAFLITLLLLSLLAISIMRRLLIKESPKKGNNTSDEHMVENSSNNDKRQPENIEDITDSLDKNTTNDDYREGIAKLIKKLKNENKKLNKEHKGSNDSHDNEIDKLANEIDELIKNAEATIVNAEKTKNDKYEKQITEEREKISTIENRVRSEMQKKIDLLDKEKECQKNTLETTKTKLESTEKKLERTQSELKNEKETVENVKTAQKLFTDKLTYTPWASDYSKKIEMLFGIASKVVTSANKLMTADVHDPYFIAKALAIYESNISSIEMPRFFAEVFMSADKNFAFNDSGIVNLSTMDEKKRTKALREYYLDNYLKKYINAIVVLNESFAGIHRLITDLPERETAPFVEYRSELENCFTYLEIKVISVKLFDKVTNNLDLKTTEIDYDQTIPKDSILEIKNCIVYASGASRPAEKIYVKSQK